MSHRCRHLRLARSQMSLYSLQGARVPDRYSTLPPWTAKSSAVLLTVLSSKAVQLTELQRKARQLLFHGLRGAHHQTATTKRQSHRSVARRAPPQITKALDQLRLRLHRPGGKNLRAMTAKVSALFLVQECSVLAVDRLARKSLADVQLWLSSWKNLFGQLAMRSAVEGSVVRTHPAPERGRGLPVMVQQMDCRLSPSSLQRSLSKERQALKRGAASQQTTPTVEDRTRPSWPSHGTIRHDRRRAMQRLQAVSHPSTVPKRQSPGRAWLGPPGPDAEQRPLCSKPVQRTNYHQKMVPVVEALTMTTHHPASDHQHAALPEEGRLRLSPIADQRSEPIRHRPGPTCANSQPYLPECFRRRSVSSWMGGASTSALRHPPDLTFGAPQLRRKAPLLYARSIAGQAGVGRGPAPCLRISRRGTTSHPHLTDGLLRRIFRLQQQRG